VPAASAAAGGPEPGPIEIVGVRYSFSAYANTVRGPRAGLGISTLAGSGKLRPGASTSIRIRGSLKPPSGDRVTFTAAGTAWRLDYTEPVSTLVIELEVVTTSDASVCETGAHGTVTVVDNDRRLAGGPTRDSVRLRFLDGACRALARTWTNADSRLTSPKAGGPGGGQRAAVEVTLRTGPARPLPVAAD
jgi:hypothetical protein